MAIAMNQMSWDEVKRLCKRLSGCSMTEYRPAGMSVKGTVSSATLNQTELNIRWTEEGGTERTNVFLVSDWLPDRFWNNKGFDLRRDKPYRGHVNEPPATWVQYTFYLK